IIQKNWVWASVVGMTIFLVVLMLLPDPFIAAYRVPLLSAGMVHTAILIIKRYSYFKSWPEPQSWIGRPVRKS
ncbi:MAG: hypothetical protein NTV42_00235, partial [Chloroflexi bacterium]|nr:hypothetical protein [Chloroflexota bacterium]